MRISPNYLYPDTVLIPTGEGRGKAGAHLPAFPQSVAATEIGSPEQGSGRARAEIRTIAEAPLALDWRARRSSTRQGGLTRSTISGSPGEEREIVRGGGRKSEAVSERDLRSRLQAGDLQHPGCPWEVCCEHGTKVFHHLLGDHLALVARDSVIDLHEVDPAHHRSPCEQPLNSGECGLLTIQPGKDGPRVEADVHRGSRARSSSRRAAIPVFANRPPSFTADRRATSTISSSRSSKSTRSPGCR
jgi:hypothetical protein